MHAPAECAVEEYFEFFEKDNYRPGNGRIGATHNGDIVAAVPSTYHFKLRVLWRIIISISNGSDPDIRVPRTVPIE